MEKFPAISKDQLTRITGNLATKGEGSGRMLFLDDVVDIGASMTWNAAWHDFDCSALVPEGTEAVLLAVDITKTGDYLAAMEFRRKGDADTLAYVRSTGVGGNNYGAAGTVIIPVDDDLIFEYHAPSGSPTKKIVNLYGYIT